MESAREEGGAVESAREEGVLEYSGFFGLGLCSPAAATLSFLGNSFLARLTGA